MMPFVVAIAGALFGFIIGRINVFLNVRFEAYKQKILDFYSPIYTNHMLAAMDGTHDFLSFPNEARDKIYTHIVKNIVYIDKDLVKTVSDLMYQYETHTRNPDHGNVKQINESYRKIYLRSAEELISASGRLFSPKLLDVLWAPRKRPFRDSSV